MTNKNPVTVFKIDGPQPSGFDPLPFGEAFFTIHGPDRSRPPLVSMSMTDGSMTFGPDYEPTEAARIFWEALSQDYRDMLKWKEDHK